MLIDFIPVSRLTDNLFIDYLDCYYSAVTGGDLKEVPHQ